ncbi:MarR family winged helix-turn-helix transcriptional regulator [Thioflexithrix psekupsensis]|uniref:MarR family transcriptional regulator n=1 Tax=Thioflexithrix psekupsensis TaxID=1570016 RepID=A0A251X814_9GAMM|nr:MarR family transcriptional regulator [Thioflexithrix psekupsensis]OUD14075.1 MarR family transcriptional regulator [Thioflexithrix psekupsensis]
MSDLTRTAAGAALSDLVLDLFRVSNQMLTAGDRLVAELGLTSVRWQILGEIVAAEKPQPVAWLARDMGVNRQNVQRVINDLEKEGLVTFAPNPHHRRASLVVLTEKGQQIFDAAMRLQVPWINQLSDGLHVEEIKITHKIMTAIQEKLERDLSSFNS